MIILHKILPGPILIIPCPACGFTGKKKALLSGNNFGAELWSDGKQIAPMLPEYPYLVRCKKCRKFFFAEDDNSIDELSWGEYNYVDKWKDVKFFKFPTFRQYIAALGSGLDEKYIRYSAFKSFNDYIRKNREHRITPEMREHHHENMNRLSELFATESTDELFSLIEVNRQLGRFDKCKELLEKVNDKDLDWIKEQFAGEIDKKNRKLFKLRQPYY